MLAVGRRFPLSVFVQIGRPTFTLERAPKAMRRYSEMQRHESGHEHEEGLETKTDCHFDATLIVIRHFDCCCVCKQPVFLSLCFLTKFIGPFLRFT